MTTNDLDEVRKAKQKAYWWSCRRDAAERRVQVRKALLKEEQRKFELAKLNCAQSRHRFLEASNKQQEDRKASGSVVNLKVA